MSFFYVTDISKKETRKKIKKEKEDKKEKDKKTKTKAKTQISSKEYEDASQLLATRLYNVVSATFFLSTVNYFFSYIKFI
jgi:hypothetical protein